MNREIKFRAWDNKRNNMMRIYRLSWSIDGCVEALDGWVNDRGFPAYAEHVDLMQFTGLKDKNGKEIYEGDIVQSELGRRHNVFAVIEWDNERARYTDFSPRGEFEIIGNIYENPELLENKLTIQEA